MNHRSMALDLKAFVALRPYAYHLTSASNLASIRESGQLKPAADLLEAANANEWLNRRRPDCIVVKVGRQEVVIRDQRPLHRGNLLLEAGFLFEDFVRLLNSHIYFWPGTAEGPNDYGRRHFARYEEESPAILRVPTADLLRANQDLRPRVCRFNSGSPRCVGGKRSPRSPRTFCEFSDFAGTASQVVELTFPAPITIPESTRVRQGKSGEFVRLFA